MKSNEIISANLFFFWNFSDALKEFSIITSEAKYVHYKYRLKDIEKITFKANQLLDSLQWKHKKFIYSKKEIKK